MNHLPLTSLWRKSRENLMLSMMTFQMSIVHKIREISKPNLTLLKLVKSLLMRNSKTMFWLKGTSNGSLRSSLENVLYTMIETNFKPQALNTPHFHFKEV